MDTSVRAKLSALVPRVKSASGVLAVESSRFPILKKSDTASHKDDQNAHLFFEINGLPGIEAIAGDDAKSIAKAAGIRIPRFLRSNEMSVEMPILPGNIYYLTLKHKNAPVPFHTVKTGDSWQRISQQYGIRLVNLLKFNRTIFKNPLLQTGQVVWLNKRRPRKTSAELTTPEPADTTAISPMIAALSETQSLPPKDAEINPLEREKYASASIDEKQNNTLQAKQNPIHNPKIHFQHPLKMPPAYLPTRNHLLYPILCHQYRINRFQARPLPPTLFTRFRMDKRFSVFPDCIIYR